MIKAKYVLMCRLDNDSISHILGSSNDKKSIEQCCDRLNSGKYKIRCPDDKIRDCKYEVVHTNMYSFEIDLFNQISLEK